MNLELCHVFSFTYFNINIDVILFFLRNKYLEDLNKNDAALIESNLHVDKFIENSVWMNPEKENKDCFEALFYTPEGLLNQTIMISNVSDGWNSMGYYIAHNLSCEVYKFRIDDEYYEEPMNSFSYKKRETSRVVYSIKEGKKWTFCELGEPLLFENIDYYKRRLVKQRMNRTILMEYIEKIGLFITHDEFFKISFGAKSFMFKLEKIR